MIDTSGFDSRLGGNELSIFTANDEEAFTRASQFLQEKQHSPFRNSRNSYIYRQYSSEKKAAAARRLRNRNPTLANKRADLYEEPFDIVEDTERASVSK